MLKSCRHHLLTACAGTWGNCPKFGFGVRVSRGYACCTHRPRRAVNKRAFGDHFAKGMATRRTIAERSYRSCDESTIVGAAVGQEFQTHDVFGVIIGIPEVLFAVRPTPTISSGYPMSMASHDFAPLIAHRYLGGGPRKPGSHEQ